MASVKLILRTYQADQTGHCPLYIRVIKDRKTKFITAGVKLKESEWDETKQRVKKNHPNSTRMNASLSQKMADAEGQVADLERKVKSVSVSKLKEAIKGKEVPNFFEYAKKRLARVKSSISYNTHLCYETYTKKFENHIGTKDLYFDDITVTSLKEYVRYMSDELKNGPTTMNYSLRILAIIFKDAIRDEVIPETMFPFSKISIKCEKGKRIFLNKVQIESIKTADIESKNRAHIFRDMFLFSIYAGGLRFSDVVTLKWENYIEAEQRIKKLIRKTDSMHQFKIGKVAIDILEKYKPTDLDSNAFIFPIITNVSLFDKDAEYQQKIIRANNIACGRCLHKLGEKIKLPHILTFHLSRHTFATNALNNGMRIEHVSKLMGHQDISTTQIYAKIISEELDKAVDNYIY